MRLLQDLRVGATITAKVVNISYESKRMALSPKRSIESNHERYFCIHKNQKVTAIVKHVEQHEATLTLGDNAATAILLLRNTLWSRDLLPYLTVNETINVKVTSFDPKRDEIFVSIKGLICGNFQLMRDKMEIGSIVNCEVLFCDYDRVVVAIVCGKLRAHGYIYQSEISEWISFNASLLRLVFIEGSIWRCAIKRVDYNNELIELSRKNFFKFNVDNIKPSQVHEVLVLRGRQNGQTIGYSPELEGIFVDDGSWRLIQKSTVDALVASVRSGKIELACSN